MAEAASNPKAALVPLRANRNFRMLWVGQVLSDLGSQIGTLAYPLLVLALTHSVVIAGAVGTVASAAAFAVRLPAGALADRLDRRRTMMACDAVRAVALAVLAALVALGALAWPIVMVVAVIDRAGDTLFTPASTAALPLIVDNEQLEAAWAATEARQYAANLAGPALGGLLFGLGRAVPFVADAVSYGISFLTASRIDGQFGPPGDAERRGLWAEAMEGVRMLWRDRLLRAVLIQAPLLNFAFTGAIFTVTLGLRRHGSSAVVVGGAQAAIMLGGLLGAFAAPAIQRRVTVMQSILLLSVPGSVLMGVAAVVMPSPAVAIPLAIPLLLSPATNAVLFSALLRQTPESMRGRVNNALLQVAIGLATLAPLVSGLVIEHLSARWAMGVFALVLASVTPVALRFPALGR
jgi:MFS family permease